MVTFSGGLAQRTNPQFFNEPNENFQNGNDLFVCPEKSGFFAHHKNCDKYWACENSTAILKTCGNGLVFDESDSLKENCAYPFSVDCGSRTDLGKLLDLNYIK